MEIIAILKWPTGTCDVMILNHSEFTIETFYIKIFSIW